MSGGVAERLRLSLEAAVRRHPFLRLAQHFCGRATGVSSTSDFDFGLGGLLALLAIPGAFSSILLMDKYSSLLQFLRGQPHFNPYVSCLPDEYFFIVYSMAITGLITLLRWDQLLPDARDFANLGSLSLSPHRIFLANVTALATLAGLFAIDINLVSSVVFPVLVTIQSQHAGAFFEVMFAHVLATLGISTFTFLSIIALQGLLMSLFPDRLYRRMALALRTALLILLTGTLISVFLLPMPFLQVNYASLKAVAWWPPLWFLALFESHIQALQSRSLQTGGFACRALASAALLTIGGFSLSYKRYFLKIPERQSASVASQKTWLPFRSTLSLFRPILTPGFETACFQFTVRTLLRSETHLLFAGLWAGIGLLLMLEGLRLQAHSLLIAPLTFTLFSLSGIRFVFDIAGAANANWPFRLIASDSGRLVRSACRKLLLLAGLIPLLLIWFPASVQEAGWRLATLYLWFHVLSVSILVELLLWKFHKVPFTCSMIPNRDRFLKMFAGIVVMLVLILPLLASIEAAVVKHPLTLPLFIGALMAALVWLHRDGARDLEPLIYEDVTAPAFVLLRLGNE